MDLETIYIQQVVAGDVNRFAWFVEKYQDMAFATALGIVKNSQDAEEVVQDAFLSAYRSLASFKGKSKFSTWLCRITINGALSRLQKNRTEQKYEDIELSEEQVADIECVYNKLNNADQTKYIRLAMEKMTTEDSLILTLYYLNEQTIDEISFMLGISRENIKMKLHRARKKCYTILSKILHIPIKTI